MVTDSGITNEPVNLLHAQNACESIVVTEFGIINDPVKPQYEKEKEPIDINDSGKVNVPFKPKQ